MDHVTFKFGERIDCLFFGLESLYHISRVVYLDCENLNDQVLELVPVSTVQEEMDNALLL